MKILKEYGNPMERNQQERPTQEGTREIINCTNFPIMLGVLCGMLVWIVLALIEAPSFYTISVRIFNEPIPKVLFSKPGDCWVHRGLLMILALMGGSLGVMFSQWPKKKSIIFLLAILVIITIFAAIGFR